MGVQEHLATGKHRAKTLLFEDQFQKVGSPECWDDRKPKKQRILEY